MTDVALLLDTSPHINPIDFSTQLSVARQILQVSEPDYSETRFSFSTFSDTYDAVFKFDQYQTASEMTVKINMQGLSRSNNRYGKLKTALDFVATEGFSLSSGARVAARKVIVLITPGHFADFEHAKPSIIDLKDTNTTLVTVGVGNNSNITVLQDTASDPALSYFFSDEAYNDLSVLKSLLSTFEFEICKNI